KFTPGHFLSIVSPKCYFCALGFIAYLEYHGRSTLFMAGNFGWFSLYACFRIEFLQNQAVVVYLVKFFVFKRNLLIHAYGCGFTPHGTDKYWLGRDEIK